ncbi:MAG: phenylalanine--tRNA ligase subunit beta [candidate division Zixibacteria bacterium]|nr:phenylalanine--tRNA ligase subunit beta [candidate division Zixibacteria bacterium]
MRISYLWLKELTGLEWSAEEMAERLTLCGIANEEVTSTAKYLDKVVVGEVLEVHPVEGASRIRRTIVDVGREKLQVICGAPNVAVGQKVPVAQVGAKVAGEVEIKAAKIRGVDSAGMICAEDELGISSDHAGIMVLDPSAPVGAALKDHLEYDDYILGFELTPNRGDAWSAIGIARDLAALGGVTVKRPEIKLRESLEKTSIVIKVTSDDLIGCPRYAGRVIRNIKVGPSPWWIKKKLLTAGIRPISNVVDITNLVMLECGNPLHAFDLEQFGSNEVVVRRAIQGEKFTTLDGLERTLTSQVLMITNGKHGVAVAGIMGGLHSEVTEKTTTLLLEAAYFSPIVIRRGRKELGMVTESSARFERGVDPNNIQYAIDRAAALFQDICGGEVLGGTVDCYPQKIESKQIALRPDRCRAIMGTDLPAARMKAILEGLEFQVTGEATLAVTVPTFRSDISTEIDLIEEVARIHGWGNIADAVENVGPLYSPANAEDIYENELRRILNGIGFDEVLGHGLADGRLAEMMNPGLPQVKISNPVSDDLSIMRNSLLPSALGIASHNVSHRITDLRLFELGRAYFPPCSGRDWTEEERLSLLVTGNSPANWRDKARPVDFYDLKAAVETLALHYHLPTFEYVPTSVAYLEREISFTIHADGQPLGIVGKLTDQLAKKFDIRQDVYAAELYLPVMMRLSRALGKFSPLPIYPAAPRDLAIVIDQSIKVGEMLDRIKNVAGPLAESITVFDVYAGKQIEQGKKSIGVAIVYRSPERSLSSDEIDAAQQAIMKTLRDEFRADIREK